MEFWEEKKREGQEREKERDRDGGRKKGRKENRKEGEEKESEGGERGRGREMQQALSPSPCKIPTAAPWWLGRKLPFLLEKESSQELTQTPRDPGTGLPFAALDTGIGALWGREPCFSDSVSKDTTRAHIHGR